MTELEELIKRFKQFVEGTTSQTAEEEDLYNKVIETLENQPFSVLQHLQDGGICKCDNTFLRFNGESFQLQFNHRCVYPLADMWESATDKIVMTVDWQPYHEPSAEHSKAWAAEEMGGGSFVRFDGMTAGKYLYIAPCGTIRSSDDMLITDWEDDDRWPVEGWYVMEDPALTLEKLLQKARDHVITPHEAWQQRISFVYGQMMDCAPHITREEVENHATTVYGPCPEPETTKILLGGVTNLEKHHD